MRGNTTKVKNIKKYLLAALFNAPSTMNGYYQAEVNHDMPGLARQEVHMFILKLAGKILLLPVWLILFVGVFVDTVLDMTRERIIDFIIS